MAGYTAPLAGLPGALAKLQDLRAPACAFCLLDQQLGIDDQLDTVPADFVPARSVTVVHGSLVCAGHVVAAFVRADNLAAAARNTNPDTPLSRPADAAALAELRAQVTA